jgi:hypothetical protein
MADVIDVFKGLPRRLHIGAHTYRVVLSSPAKCEDLVENHGVTDFENFKIYLDETMPAHLAATIVQHEVTHCINLLFGIDDDSTEETFTTQHSRGQIDFWIRNPRAFTWMAKSLRRIRQEAARD